MLSADGRCKSFGKGGDGFVPGEGVGVVLLKRLSQAVADEDQIHAVIRGTSINHGGKTNGYTVPNPVAQKELVRAAFAKAGVNARMVSYIEAHGTGTELGDPIEISGLTQAFAQDTADKQFCAIGSAKSNIGHLEAAAGIAGLSKVVLQLKHRQLVPSLHAEELNPHIDFADSPFVVQRELEEWRRPVLESEGVGREHPRIAGVSSFGAGGSNAHVVIEEYVPRAEAARPSVVVDALRPALVVLSAKNEERLKAQAGQLVAAIGRRALGDDDLADIAYTLQVGREAMECRLGLTAASMAELVSKLKRYLADESGIEELYSGEIRREKETLALFADEDMTPAIEAWVAKGKYGKLLEVWVKGLSLDWQRLYGEARPRRISLPTYPFAKERYWIETGIETSGPAAAATSGTAAGVAVLHPLLHRNTSDLSAQRFSTRLSGEEFYLRDHVVGGARVLPGVAHLEMARAAVAAAAGADAQAGIRLQQVVWLRPVVVGAEGLELHVELLADDDGEIGYEIYSEAAAGEAGDRVTHSQGRAVIGALGELADVDVAGLQARCDHRLAAADCYARFAAQGLNYGPSYQGVTGLSVGMEGTQRAQVLARLELPSCVGQTSGDYVLHPSIMDAALQASLGLSARRGCGGGPAVAAVCAGGDRGDLGEPGAGFCRGSHARRRHQQAGHRRLRRCRSRLRSAPRLQHKGGHERTACCRNAVDETRMAATIAAGSRSAALRAALGGAVRSSGMGERG